MTACCRGGERVKRRSRTGKLGKICLMKANEPVLWEEGFTRTKSEQSLFPSR